MNAKKAGIVLGLSLTALPALLVHTRTFSRLGRWLRDLSLSGSVGNTAAWAAVLLLSALPALGLLRRGRSRKDWLLLFSALQILTGLYFLVNPTLLGAPQEIGDIWGITAAGGACAALLAWAVLRELERLEEAVSLGETLAKLLDGAGCLFLCLSGWNNAAALYSRISQTAAGNTAIPDQLFPTYFFLVLLAAAGMVPTLLGCLVLMWGGKLARTMEADPFGAETAALAERLSRWCARTSAASVLICAAGNALQMLFFPALQHITALISFPVITLLLAGALGLLCRYIRQAKAISDDNDSII